MVLSILSCVCWPPVCLLWWKVSLGCWPIYWLGCLLWYRASCTAWAVSCVSCMSCSSYELCELCELRAACAAWAVCTAWAAYAVCAAWAVDVFSRWLPCQLLCLHLFSPILRVLFLSCIWFPLLFKAFKFNYFPFVYFCFYFHYFWRWVQKDFAEIYVKVKSKGERERYIQLNAEFQTIARRHKKAFLINNAKK